MGLRRVVCFAWLFLASCAAASLDFSVSANIPSSSNRFGVDPQGNILIAASTGSCTLPTVNPLYPCGPIWVGKLDASGQKLLFATYLGNGAASSYTGLAGIAADSNGNIILAAHTTAPDLPTANAVQPFQSQFASLYVAKISADGSRLIYATYLGGSGTQTALSLAVDGAGAAYVAASTTSADFPTTPGALHDLPPFLTAVAKLGPDGALQYASAFSFSYLSDVKPIQLDTYRGVLLASDTQVVTLAPDGASLTRAPLPAWANKPITCTLQSGNNIVCPGRPWILPRPGGGYQFVGTAAGGVPVTVDALQKFDDVNGYVRIEDGQGAYPQIPGPVSGFAIDAEDRNRVYAAASGGLFLSADNGLTWSRLHDGPCLAIAIDPFDSNRLYLSVDAERSAAIPPKVYRSTDGGASWTAISGGPQGNAILSIAADPNIPGLLYAAGSMLSRSTDGGDTWDSRWVGPSRQDMSPSASTTTHSVSVQVDPTHPGWAYVAGTTSCIGFCPVTQNLSQTRDGGNTWTGSTTGPDPLISTFAAPLVTVDPNTGDVLEAVIGGTPAASQLMIYHSGDLSASQVLYPGETTSVAFDPEHPGAIYLGIHIAQGSGSGYFVVKSVDDGLSWTQVLQLDRPVYSLTVGAGGVLHASETPDLPKGYVLVTDAMGNAQYGTYLGGAFTQVASVAESGGKVFVAGKTQGGLPLMNSAQPVPGGGTDGFVAAFDDSGTLLWSTYLGGSADDSIDWVLPVSDGSVVVVGTTQSTDFPSLQQSPLGAGLTFIAHLR